MDIKEKIEESIRLKQKMLDADYVQTIQDIGNDIVSALKNGNTVFTAGNGGSAADAQHFAAELAGKFETERQGLRAVCLNTNVSNITAIANDYSYEEIFSRQLAALGKSGDVYIPITTSGSSANLVRAGEYSRAYGIKTLGLLGTDGGTLKNLCDNSLVVPSKITPRIQESHIMIIHIMCTMIDDAFLNS